MIVNLSQTPSLVSIYINELRDKTIQKDSLRFRYNLERISQLLAYEVSKHFAYNEAQIETPLGEKKSVQLSENIVVSSILRAGLPMHQGVLNMFDRAENSFISAYRKHHKSGQFEIKLEYISSPSIDGKILLICDPMIATGASIIATLEEIARFGNPQKIIILGIIASKAGIDAIKNANDEIDIFIGDIDEELTAKGYIVPGLGDAGDLAFGEKIEL